MSAAFQVVLEWGVRGLEATAAHVTIVAAAVPSIRADAIVALAGERAAARSGEGTAGIVLRADLGTAVDAARAAYEAQLALAERASIAIIAVGGEWPSEESSGSASGGRDGVLRPMAGDELVAGAVVDALCEFGIDFHTPACAIAAAAYATLRGAATSIVRAEAASRP
ncbi:hypothetical protein GCM10011490_17360 [Pseudoclavibacter endophyticus]|uniref:Uncharacterized protein n=1 Tax=Pseudoclavibacter endophyticus TaxID=1778590 RepID=A0A6H9WM67_9MICO|nr:hypothetical protein [Pseudoclavibacter endophyticus]KAB1648911.1 hypothetical protein F8O04_00985 [Pseudoclavibacter endophyticus]GGA67318.1 hypothetical protein GCM10011490_17360 [Pseudoclavibacter endophyticus]